MCLYPRLIKNRKYLPNKKNGGHPPPVNDTRTQVVAKGCGQCIECRKRKARDWQVRLLEDIKQNKNGKFITLTFSDESLKKLIPLCKGKTGYELDNAIATLAVRLFLERFRKKYKKSLRHWLVTELGHNGTERIHLHGIIWTNLPLTEIERIWNYGWMWKGKGEKKINYVSAVTISYITKYVHKIDEKHPKYNSIILTSPGIGANYTTTGNYKNNKFKEERTIETYKTSTGHEISMPIYWRNKIYTEEEREKLWINKLNKNERWVCGEKVKATDADEYYKLLKWHRERSKKLGYNTNELNWDKQLYEEMKRKLMYETFLKNNEKESRCITGTLLQKSTTK